MQLILTDALRFNRMMVVTLQNFISNPSSNNSCFINFDKLRDLVHGNLVVYDSTLNTADNHVNQRIKLFVNGRRILKLVENRLKIQDLPINAKLGAGVANVLFGADGGSNTSNVTAMDTFFVDGSSTHTRCVWF